MIVRKRNIFTGKVSAVELNVTPEQIARWQGGELIQNAMPQLSTDEREFLISGLLPEEWDELMSEEERNSAH